MGLLSHQKPVVAALCKHFRSRETVKFGERNIHPPVIVSASVSSGKSIMLAETAKAVREAALAKDKPTTVFVMIIQAQGILCDQNSSAAWSVGLQNSIFSASLKRRSTHYSVVYGTIGTIARALDTHRFSAYTPEEMAMTPERRFRLGKFHPDLILIDENHQVPFESPDSQYMKTLNHFYDMKPYMRLAGMTGSPFRASQSIIGDTPDHLWRAVASIKPDDPEYPEGGVGDGVISTEFSIDQGWIVGPVFGYPDDDDVHYDFSHMAESKWDYPEDELDAAVVDKELCLKICADFVKKTADRKGVLIFAATQRHTRQISAALKLLGVEPDQIGIITDKVKQAEQDRILKAAQAGDLKYVINVSVLTTGVNVPWWDTVVFMRPIASIVLLIQAIGRVLRLLIGEGDVPMLERDELTADERKALIAASDKPDALVLDYAGVMDTLKDLYDNPVLEQADLAKAKKDELNLIECPACLEQNSPNARRCIGRDRQGVRCEFFFSYRECPACRTKNDTTARECRNELCRRALIDPNAALHGKHYTDGESIPVRAMQVLDGAGGKISIRYELADGRAPIEIYYPQAGKQRVVNSRIWAAWVAKLPIPEREKLRLSRMKAETIMKNLDLIPVPAEISAREKNGKWTVGRRLYAEGMEIAL